MMATDNANDSERNARAMLATAACNVAMPAVAELVACSLASKFGVVFHRLQLKARPPLVHSTVHSAARNVSKA